LSIVTSWSVAGGILLGIGGIVFGILGRSRAKRGEASNGGVALGGTITGAVGIVCGALWIVFYVAIFNSDSVSNLRDCLDKAGSDQAKQTQCQTQFQHDFTK